MSEKKLVRHPIDDSTFDLLFATAVKLDELEVHERFSRGDRGDRPPSRRLQEQDRLQADLLVEGLRQRLGTAPRPDDSAPGAAANRSDRS